MKAVITLLCSMFFFTALQAQGGYKVTINRDTVQFEAPYEHLSIDNSSQNIWQIGSPQKEFFNASFSGEKAMVTDTMNPYPPNNISHFDFYIGAFNYGGENEPFDSYPYNIFMELKHKYDTDFLKDGGYLTISYDNGATWVNIIEDNTYYLGETPNWVNENLYSDNQTLFNGEKGFSGNSGDWVSTWFAWHFLPVKNSLEEIGDTMILRFNFISDEIDNPKEGWMIDDIRLYSVDLGTNIEEFGRGENVHIYPNPIQTSTLIDLEKTFEEIDIVVLVTMKK